MKKKTKVIIGVVSAFAVLAVIVGSFNIYFAVVGNKMQYGVAQGYEWSAQDAFDTQITTAVDMGEDDFRILVLTDIHLKNHGTFAAWLGINYLLDWASKGALDKLVKKTSPDLILVLGDTVLTARNDIETARFVGIMDAYGVPWACVFGNHDDEGRADKAKLVDVLLQSKNGLFRYGPSDLHGAGNYVIELTRGGCTEYALFMMDSGSSKEFDAGTAGINDAQVEWYDWNMSAFEVKCGFKPANMAFFHIPTPVYERLEQFEQGSRNEPSCSEGSGNGIVEAMLASNGTHIFVGHDHNNNFIAQYETMKLCYGTKSSYNCYYKSGLTGGTLLTVNAQNEVTEEIVLFS